MKIGLISDVHASPAPLREAFEIFKREAVSKIICAGDIAGYNEELDETIELLIKNNCDCIIGNHDQSYLQSNPQLSHTDSYQFLEQLPETLSYQFENKRILVVHAHPPSEQHGGIKLLDEDNKIIESQLSYWQEKLSGLNADILIVGHTHQVYAEQIGDVLVINPGSAPYNHSCMVLQLPEMILQTHALENKEIIATWNWGMLIRNQ